MPNQSGQFPQIPQDVALQVKAKIEDLMEHATIAANQGLAAVEEVVAAGAHSGTAAVVSQTKAIEINGDLTRIITACTELSHKLGISVAQFAQHDHDASSRLQAITPS
jgi:hypothetical protein